MTGRLNWRASRSSRRRPGRRRVLRFDELESRRLLHGASFDDEFEDGDDDEFESEDRFEADDDDSRLASSFRSAVVDWDDVYESYESEDDEREDESESASESDAQIAAPVVDAIWFVPAVVPVVSGTPRDDDAADEISISPVSSIVNTTPAADDEVAAAPTRTTDKADAFEEADSSGPETSVSTVRESLEPGRDEQSATSSSSELSKPTGAVVAPTETADEAPGPADHEDTANPAANAASVAPDDASLATNDEDGSSPTPTRNQAGDSDATTEVPSLRRGGASREVSSTAREMSRHTLRPVANRAGDADDARAWAVAALAADSPDAGDGRLRDALSQDLAALETALQDLLADTGELGRDVAEWLMRPDVMHWTLAATIALMAAELARRKVQRARAAAEPSLSDGADVALRLFPELLGLPPGARP